MLIRIYSPNFFIFTFFFLFTGDPLPERVRILPSEHAPKLTKFKQADQNCYFFILPTLASSVSCKDTQKCSKCLRDHEEGYGDLQPVCKRAVFTAQMMKFVRRNIAHKEMNPRGATALTNISQPL